MCACVCCSCCCSRQAFPLPPSTAVISTTVNLMFHLYGNGFDFMCVANLAFRPPKPATKPAKQIEKNTSSTIQCGADDYLKELSNKTKKIIIQRTRAKYQQSTFQRQKHTHTPPIARNLCLASADDGKSFFNPFPCTIRAPNASKTISPNTL